MFSFFRSKKKQDGKTWALIVLIVIIVTAFLMKISSLMKGRNTDDVSKLEQAQTQKKASDQTANIMRQFDVIQEAISSSVQNKERVIRDDRQGKEEIIRQAILYNKILGNDEGRVVVLERESTYIFHIVAKLPDLVRGYFYESWLVHQKPYQAISIGRMSRSVEGEYALDFTSSLEYKDYAHAAVTIEKDDGNPEMGEIVLQGKF